MILRKKQVGHQPQTRIEKRVATLSTPDLLSWMEQSMYTIGKLVATWQKSPNEALIDEVILGTEVFNAIAKELKQRTKSML
jgi:hypothetical protein